VPIESIIPYLDADSLQPAAGTDLGTLSASSKDLGWNGVHVERGRNDHFETDHVVIPDHYFVLLLSTELRWEAKQGSEFKPVLTRQGEVMINPAHTVMSTRVPQPSEFAILTVQPDRLWQAVQGTAMSRPASRNFGFEQRYQTNDPLLRQLMLTCLAEAERGGANGRLFVDSLTTALAVHYIGSYGVAAPLEAPKAAGLDARRLKRATEYLDAHFADDVSLDLLASEVAMSKFHLIRLFKQSTGLSPDQYTLKRPMDKGLQLLQQGSMPVAQVAYAVGFGDQSAFSSHFKKHFGRTPSEVRRG
jgi:AraC family transcriptional regulator